MFWRMKRMLWLVLLAACGGGDTDYSKKPLEPKTVTLEGVTFTISVPKGLPTDSDEKPGTWNVTKVEGDYVPKIFTMITTVGQSDVDAFAKWKIFNKDKMNLVRKETRPDGFAITDAPVDKHRIEAITLKRFAGEKGIECNAVQIAEGELKSYDATKKMLEAICDSISVAAPK
jgi:hypothetical protein